jgi:hypothetical protein
MRDYRMYFLTPENHIVSHLTYEGVDDLSALSKALSIVDDYAIDIRESTRHVAMVTRNSHTPVFGDSYAPKCC